MPSSTWQCRIWHSIAGDIPLPCKKPWKVWFPWLFLYQTFRIFPDSPSTFLHPLLVWHHGRRSLSGTAFQHQAPVCSAVLDHGSSKKHRADYYMAKLLDHTQPEPLLHGLFCPYKLAHNSGFQYPTVVFTTPFVFLNTSSMHQKQPAPNVAFIKICKERTQIKLFSRYYFS